jgi:hypothetical protein
MFTSIHSQKWLKYILSKKKFIVNLEIKVGDKYTFINVEVFAHYKSDAINKAKEKTMQEIKIISKGSKCLGREKNFNEF